MAVHILGTYELWICQISSCSPYPKKTLFCRFARDDNAFVREAHTESSGFILLQAGTFMKNDFKPRQSKFPIRTNVSMLKSELSRITRKIHFTTSQNLLFERKAYHV